MANIDQAILSSLGPDWYREWIGAGTDFSKLTGLQAKVGTVGAIANNVNKLPGAAPATAAKPYYYNGDPFKIASDVNAYMTKAAVEPYRANLPQYDALVGKRSNVIADQMAGKVGDDVLQQLIQSAAERGIVTGSPMGSGSNAAYLRALGLTSMDLQNKGLTNFSKAIEDTPVPQLLNPGSMIVPERVANLEWDRYQSILGNIMGNSVNTGSTGGTGASPFLPGLAGLTSTIKKTA
jgi:hypothetical protein